MASDRIGDMSMAELQALIRRMIDEHASPEAGAYRQQSRRSLQDVIESMRQNIIVPAPDTPSVVELLREDRDR